MPLEFVITPHGKALVREATSEAAATPARAGQSHDKRILAAFAGGTAGGLWHLATSELQTALTEPLAFARDFARRYLTQLCHTPGLETGGTNEPIAPPPELELSVLAAAAPPMTGIEYLDGGVLAAWWRELDEWVSEAIRVHPGGAKAYLQEHAPQWRLVGRVTFHLAENKRDPQYPFAFMASYVSRLSAQGRPQHEPLGRALEQYAGEKNRPVLLALLTPIHQAAERSTLVGELVESGDVYHPLAWTPREAYRFLQDIPQFDESGLVVRVPDWWKNTRPPRPTVDVKVASRKGTALGVDAMLDFDVGVALEGEALTSEEVHSILSAESGLVLLKGKWVEVDREKLAAALSHWRQIEEEAEQGGISFFEGMRLLSGAQLDRDAAAAVPPETKEWTGITASDELERQLSALRDPEAYPAAGAKGLRAQLRPYQQTGVGWLRLVTRLGLGACLADDMGLGKTVQVIALLVDRKRELGKKAPAGADRSGPSLLVVPASLIANWKSEIERFAPDVSVAIAHPSELPAKELNEGALADGHDLVITTYHMLPRLSWLAERNWDLVVLDEAQAIKNPGTRQAKAVKQLRSRARIALSGTPVENRLGDLWSLFDFLNPGLLGSAKAFTAFAKKLSSTEGNTYGPLRSLIKPYLLRRLKTDKRVIADLPDKTEVTAYCGLSKRQAALYKQTVDDLARKLDAAEGIQRRGLVLSQLMRLKQICNHPAQVMGGDEYLGDDSGKFQRLAAIAAELAERQEKALVFTQFREIAQSLADYLAGVFGERGLVLHGGTSVANRRKFVETFQREDGPPFFVLSLKAGGTGLNLTAASHVIHFDRWWNPAVENQATDRAFRIGQKRNVLVHKFVCRGTVEEKIDALLAEKSSLVEGVLEGGGEQMLTEMDNEQLLRTLSLDIHKALDA